MPVRPALSRGPHAGLRPSVRRFGWGCWLGLLTFTVMILHAFGMCLTLRHRLYLCEDRNRPSVGEVRTLVKANILVMLAVETVDTAVLVLRHVLKRERGCKGSWFSLFHAVSATNNAVLALCVCVGGMAP